MSRIAWVFFDMDGTLADSLPTLYAAYAAFLSAHGKTSDRAEFDRLNGPALPDIVAALKRDHGLADPERILLARYREALRTAFAEGAGLMPHAAEAVAASRDLGLRLWLATAADESLAQAFLARWFDGRFAGLTHGGEVDRGKPSPDIYLRALEASGADPASVLVVEDSPHGVTAAKAAGLRVASVGPSRLDSDYHMATLAEWPALLKGIA